MVEEIEYSGVCRKCQIALDDHIWFKDGKAVGERMGPPVCPERKAVKHG